MAWKFHVDCSLTHFDYSDQLRLSSPHWTFLPAKVIAVDNKQHCGGVYCFSKHLLHSSANYNSFFGMVRVDSEIPIDWLNGRQYRQFTVESSVDVKKHCFLFPRGIAQSNSVA